MSIEGAEQVVTLCTDDFVNYSLAARRAWRSMPDRKVGRPLGTKLTDRLSVIFRVDRQLWSEFLAAEQEGLVPDRTSLINACLREILAAVRQKEFKAP